MKLSDYIANFLSRYTDHVFVGNGGCVVHILDSIDKHKGLRSIPCENEQAASIAAEAYTRVSGKIGVAIATSGPGMINLMQGIACAYYDSIPSFFISGAAPTSQLRKGSPVRQIGFQEMDVTGLVRPITKYAVLITEPKNIRYELEKLIYMAHEGRPGPVMLDLPDDLQRAKINPAELKGFIPPSNDRRIDPSLITQTVELIKKARKPIVIVGGGVKLSAAQKQCRQFLKRSSLPYATTWATIDMFLDNEEGLIGNFGVSANRAGNFAVQNADLIISLGSRLDTHETGSNPSLFAPAAKKIMVDIDRDELNKDNGMHVDVKINCDLKSFFSQINKDRIATGDILPWKRRIQDWKARYPVCPAEKYDRKKKVDPYVFMNELSKVTGKNDIVITDAGATLTWTMQAYKVRRPQMLFSAFNHSPMGYAICASIGAKYASPGREVICITGDGGIQMNIQELETIKYNKLPIKIFLINNGEYGIIKQTQDTWLNSRYVAADPGSGLGFPDFCRIAEAYGIRTAVIDKHKGMNRRIRSVLNSKGPVLCDVRLRSGEKITPKLEFGRPLEDLSPLLPRREFAENMKP